MAKIDEERVLLRFSTIVRDAANVANYTMVTETIRSSIETTAQNLINDAVTASGQDIQVLVEATITAGNVA